MLKTENLERIYFIVVKKWSKQEMSAILISLLKFISSAVDSEEKLDLRIVELDEGSPAPFDGLLLTSDLLTKMEVTSEKKLEEMKIEHDYSILLNDALLQSITERYTIEIDFQEKNCYKRRIYSEA